MADTAIASVVQVLPPVKSTPTSSRAGGAGRPDVETAAPHVEQARLIGSETSFATVKRQINVANKHGVALYQTVQEAVTPQEVPQGSPNGIRRRAVNLVA